MIAGGGYRVPGKPITHMLQFVCGTPDGGPGRFKLWLACALFKFQAFLPHFLGSCPEAGSACAKSTGSIRGEDPRGGGDQSSISNTMNRLRNAKLRWQSTSFMYIEEF